MPFTYAQFKSSSAAQRAVRRLRAGARDDDLRVTVLNMVSHHTVPLRLTSAGIGVFLGATSVALVAMAAVGLALSFGLPVIAPRETIALVLGISTLLGGLAGGLSFASDNSPVAQRLRRWTREGKPVVFVDDARRTHEQTLRHVGAVQVYKMR